MKKSHNYYLAIVYTSILPIFLTISSFSLSGCKSKFSNKNSSKDTIPQVTLENLDGKTNFNTKSIPKGNPIVFFYFGAFCEPSRTQMKNIIKDMEELKNINFYLFSVDSIYDIKLFYNHFQLSKYPNIIVLRDGYFKLTTHFHFNETPALAFYNKDQSLKTIIRGSIYGRELKKNTE